MHSTRQMAETNNAEVKISRNLTIVKLLEANQSDMNYRTLLANKQQMPEGHQIIPLDPKNDIN